MLASGRVGIGTTTPTYQLQLSTDSAAKPGTGTWTIKDQDVLKVIPEAVSKDEKGYLHVTNDSIIWTAVNAIKELSVKFTGHDAKIQKLERENAELKARLQKIELAVNAK